MSNITQYDKNGDVIELGDDFFANAKPLSEFPSLQAKLGKKHKPTRESITIELSPKVTDYFRATGNDWQTRIDDVLKEYVAEHS